MFNKITSTISFNSKLIKPSIFMSSIIVVISIIGLKIGGLLGVYLLMFGLMTGINARQVSLKKILILSLTMALLVGAASYGQDSLWAITFLVGLAALVTGIFEKWAVGIGHLIPIAVAVTGMVQHTQNTVIPMAWVIVGCLAGILLVYLFKIHQKPSVATASQLKIYTAVIVLMATIFAYIAIKYNLPHGYWAIFTLCAVLKPATNETISAVRMRVFGTIIGAIFGLISVLLLPYWLTTIFALLCLLFMVYYMLDSRYTKYVIVLTTLLVLLMSNGIKSEAINISELRIFLTIFSSVITALVALIIWRFQKYLIKNHN